MLVQGCVNVRTILETHVFDNVPNDSYIFTTDHVLHNDSLVTNTFQDTFFINHVLQNFVIGKLENNIIKLS